MTYMNAAAVTVVIVGLAGMACSASDNNWIQGEEGAVFCESRLSGDWWANPMGDVRFDFKSKKYSILANGNPGISTLCLKSCGEKSAVLSIDGVERRVEFESKNVIRMWFGIRGKDSVGLFRLQKEDGHLELAREYVPPASRENDDERGCEIVSADDSGIPAQEVETDIVSIRASEVLGKRPNEEKWKRVEIACEKGNVLSCACLGRIWKNRGEKKGNEEGFDHEVRARKYLQRACDMCSAEACGDALWITRHGDGSASRAFAERACALGDSTSCEMLKSYLRTGFGEKQQ